jgi:predicted dehydrogenase
MLAENYPFMLFNQEMYKVYRGGTLGKILFAEGEYNHPLDPDDSASIKKLRPYPNHWRNLLPRTYYITHSLAPLMYITGSKPVRITAMPVFAPFPADSLMGLGVGDRSAIITCLNDDDSVFRVTGCAAYGAHGNSYRLCCEKGQIENIRGYSARIMLRYNKWDVPEGMESKNEYDPDWDDKDKALIEQSGHGGGDFYVIREFLNCIRENKRPVFDEYFATTMASVAILAHRSVLERGAPYDIPDFHKEEDRVKYENDRLTPFFGSDGSEPTVPCCSHPDHKPSDEEVEKYLRILNS